MNYNSILVILKNSNTDLIKRNLNLFYAIASVFFFSSQVLSRMGVRIVIHEIIFYSSKDQ